MATITFALVVLAVLTGSQLHERASHALGILRCCTLVSCGSALEDQLTVGRIADRRGTKQYVMALWAVAVILYVQNYPFTTVMHASCLKGVNLGCWTRFVVP